MPNSALSRRELANAIRALSMDAVQQANSGHPGMPMGMADIAEVLWNDFLRFDPQQPDWPDRDRFVVSNGHGSMLLYSLLHLSGYDLPLAELKNFRQFGSKTPGHPEYGLTPGVETTTGPLGQGLANAVGMALAERSLAAQFNRPGHTIIDHYTYVFIGDGCLMEGISHEACSLAGVLGLGKLIVLYDDNGISIDGEVDGWFGDDTPKRFASYGWQVIPEVDGHDADAIRAAIEQARSNTEQPSLICCKTVIGYGSPNKAGTEATHGAPLGADEIAATRQQLGWPHAPFEIPAEIYAAWDGRIRGAALSEAWQDKLTVYREAFPQNAAELERRLAGALVPDWEQIVRDRLYSCLDESKAVATRKASGQTLAALAPAVPEMLGGSADLTGSNNTDWPDCGILAKDNPCGRYLHYGVREFGMGAILNGVALHGGFIAFGGTFLVFSDYARSALRMAALMRVRSIFVLTHDSIGLGEDGPTHQPIEHLASLRLIPNVHVWRPCDAAETTLAWKAAIERRDGPSCLVLTRQNLPPQQHRAAGLADIERGAYSLVHGSDSPDALLIASGSEVALAVHAADRLNRQGHTVRVVSMPCREVFEAQDAAYRESVLPARVQTRIVIEAGTTRGWEGYAGPQGHIIGIDRFGESAPAETLFRHFGFTEEAVLEACQHLLLRSTNH